MRAFLILAAMALSFAAAAEGRSDLHGGVNVGMMATDLPALGYKDFVCAETKGKTVTGFADFKSCPAGAEGLFRIRVAIDEPGAEETQVAGHPVDLTLGFGEDGRLARIVIDTKKTGRLFLRKKAYLLGLQAKARYGEDGWACQETPLAADEEALGPTSVKEHCDKTAGDRRVVIDRSLFRKIGADAKNFTSESHVTIDWASH